MEPYPFRRFNSPRQVELAAEILLDLQVWCFNPNQVEEIVNEIAKAIEVRYNMDNFRSFGMEIVKKE